ncbi:unnamed protein product, partial [Ectocarpus sp. 12 AP-2014]
ASESRGLGSGSGGVGVARDSRAVGTAGLCPGVPFPYGGNERCRHRQRRGIHRARRISVRGHEGWYQREGGERAESRIGLAFTRRAEGGG